LALLNLEKLLEIAKDVMKVLLVSVEILLWVIKHIVLAIVHSLWLHIHDLFLLLHIDFNQAQVVHQLLIFGPDATLNLRRHDVWIEFELLFRI